MLDARSLRAFCRQPMGVPVAFAGVRVYTDDNSTICGLYDRAVSLGLSDGPLAGLSSGKPTLQLPFNAFNPMPASGDLIEVTPLDVPVFYTVDEPTAADDGAFLLYELSLAEAPDEDAE